MSTSPNELPATLKWFNTPSPLRLIKQRGEMILLDSITRLPMILYFINAEPQLTQ